MFSKQGHCHTSKMRGRWAQSQAVGAAPLKIACLIPAVWPMTSPIIRTHKNKQRSKQPCLGWRVLPGHHCSYCHVSFGHMWLQKPFSGEGTQPSVLHTCLFLVLMNGIFFVPICVMGRGELNHKSHFTSSGSKGGGLLVSATKLFDVDWKQNLTLLWWESAAECCYTREDSIPSSRPSWGCCQPDDRSSGFGRAVEVGTPVP